MRRIYKRSRDRRQGRPFLSHVVGIAVILGGLFSLVELFSTAALDQKSHEEFWCGHDIFGAPLVYAVPFVCLLGLYLVVIEGSARLIGGEARERGFRLYYGTAAGMFALIMLTILVQWNTFGVLNRCEPRTVTPELFKYNSFSTAHRHRLQTNVCTSDVLVKREDYCGGFDPAANPVCEQYPDSYECEWELMRRAWRAHRKERGEDL